jgi:hypothetical protein
MCMSCHLLSYLLFTFSNIRINANGLVSQTEILYDTSRNNDLSEMMNSNFQIYNSNLINLV